MFPHEKALVKRYAKRPFAIIGVNSDRDRQKSRLKNMELGITWRSFWNGPLGTEGPIAARWCIGSWPTIFLIDHEGVVRDHWEGEPDHEELEMKLDALVEQAEAVKAEDD